MVSIRSRRLSAGECDGPCRRVGMPRFQSAPADCRRENALARSAATSDSFNPLPPTVGGRISTTVTATIARFQSAPADCRRENGSPAAPSATGEFQSAPADCRRENQLRQESAVSRVSIRSRRLSAGELFRLDEAPGLDVSIRSRRLSAGEFATAARYGEHCFNPLPPTVGGRMLAPADYALGHFEVSIRSRRLSAGEFARIACQAPCGFNPLPPTVGGRITPSSAAAGSAFQSAPADCRRENVCCPTEVSVGDVSIRSRRLSAGECHSCTALTGDVSIRSRRLSAGECHDAIRGHR